MRRVPQHGKADEPQGVLRLADEPALLAKAIQLGIEYDPQPPFDAGSVAKAGPELTEMVRAALDAENEHTAALDR